MSIKLERLMEALGLDIKWTEEDRAQIKERREKYNQPLDHIIDDIRAHKILVRIEELVKKIESTPPTYVNVPYELGSNNAGIVYTCIDNKTEDK